MILKKVVKIGNLKVGGRNPVRIKAMLKTPTANIKGLLAEAQALAAAGAEAIRMAVITEADAKLAGRLKQRLDVPIVADIHFHYKLALAAIENGFDCIRLNPLNIRSRSQVGQVARAAKKRGISIRVGINSGGFKKDFKTPMSMAKAMAAACQNYIKILEAEDFSDIMVSLKGADVPTTIYANRLFNKISQYPLHLGVTATGSFLQGVTKSAVGLGCLLEEGVGQIIRVSLTGPSVAEVGVAQDILSALGKRKFGHEIISCPTCSRCEADIAGIVDKFKERIESIKCLKPLRIAIMGCVVNGPGEAYQADIGVAFGKKKAIIFKKDKVLKQSSEATVIKDLLGEVKRLWT
jgi:(E)-4-hydroxy-3-methylbut-2-enyl-diphosphate synthase